MTDLTGTVWQSRTNPSRYVRVTDNGDTHAHVVACSVDGRVWMTLGGGGLHARPTRIQLNAAGTALLRYEQVVQP
jgi:hypothetical protein